MDICMYTCIYLTTIRVSVISRPKRRMWTVRIDKTGDSSLKPSGRTEIPTIHESGNRCPLVSTTSSQTFSYIANLIHRHSWVSTSTTSLCLEFLPTAMNHRKDSPQVIDPHRQLRIISAFAFLPAFAMLLPCGLISNVAWPAVGIAPMFFSSLFQAIALIMPPRLPTTTVFINTFLAVFLLAILIPRCVIHPKANS
jgi:hypothetical protein